MLTAPLVNEIHVLVIEEEHPLQVRLGRAPRVPAVGRRLIIRQELNRHKAHGNGTTARVSTRSQDHQSQLDALAAAHCREVVEETASTRRDRPKLRATLSLLHPGDTLVIYKPDRVARSMKELLVFVEDELHAHGITLEILTGVCAGIHRPDGAGLADRLLFAVAALAAEMERELIRERTLDGLRAAAAAGRHGGRPVAITAD